MTRTMRLVLVSSMTIAGSLCLTTTGMVEAAPATENSTAAPTTQSTYAVRAGDSLAGIARQFGVRLGALVRANGITMTTTIHPGDSLLIPAGGQPAVPVAAPSATYTVRPGDALASIATRSGVKLGALVKANGITASSVIMPGQVLRIPPATQPIPVPPANATPPSSAPEIAPATSAAVTSTFTSTQVLVTYLRAQVGKPYKFFTAGPDTFDCSGLAVAGFKQIGVSLPHQSRALAGVGTAVDWTTAPIVAGDLLFMSQSGDPALISHVGIALDSTSWIQAVGVGQTVRVAALPRAGKIVAVRRISLP